MTYTRRFAVALAKIQHALDAGTITPADVAELRAAWLQERPGVQRNPAEDTVFAAIADALHLTIVEHQTQAAEARRLLREAFEQPAPNLFGIPPWSDASTADEHSLFCGCELCRA